MHEAILMTKALISAIREFNRVLNKKPEFEKGGVFSANPDLSEVVIKPIRGDVSETFPFSQDDYLESKIKQASENWKGVDVEAYVNEVRGGEPKQPEPNLTDAKILATNIYTDHYIALFDSETDKGEEVTVSILAAQCALITIRHMIEVDPKSQFLRLVESEIETINN